MDSTKKRWFSPKSEETKDIIESLGTGLIIAILFIASFNVYQMSQMPRMETSETIINMPTGAVSSSQTPDIIPRGIPKIYGKELDISFDDVSSLNPSKAESTISKLGMYDDKIILKGKDLDRYISIASKISCEYCCGAESIIYSNGNSACGCSHSYAMRGLAKYLIANHAGEYTDDEILEEMGKWKVLFFPGPMASKAGILQKKGIELNYINLASNKYRGIQ